MAIPTPADFVERESQLEALAASLDAARSGTGRLAFVSGEAGVGKTALVRALCDAAGPRIRILEGACDPLATPRPLGPFADVATVIGGDLARALGSDSRPADILAALRVDFAGTTTILVLEDVHWADEATLDVIRLLARRIEDLPALVIATHRDDELAPHHPLLVALGELATARGIVRITLPRLSRSAVGVLATGGEVDPDELYDKTGGNPFFVREVLASGGELVPGNLRAAVLARCARLGPAARDVVKTVSVAPSHADSRLLDRLGIDVGAPLEEALASGVLRAAGPTVAFPHELSRQAVESSLTPTEALALHRRMLAALEADPEPQRDLARLVHHADAAGDSAGVLRYAPRAAESASSLGAHREAAAHYATALRFADEVTPERRAELLERQSIAHYLTDDQAAAIDALSGAVAYRRRTGDTLRESADLSRLVSYLACRGLIAEAERAATDALALLDGLPPSRELGAAHYARSLLCAYTGETVQAITSGATAIELAKQFDDPVTLVEASVTVATNEVLRDGIEARGPLEGALELAQQHGLDGQVARAMHNLAFCSVVFDAHELAALWLETALAYCEEHELDLWRLALLSIRVRYELERGRWADAAETAALIGTEQRDSPEPRLQALLVLALVRARRGDPDVSPLVERAAEIAAASNDIDWHMSVACVRAEIAWLTGRDDDVCAATQEALESAIEPGQTHRRLGELAYWRHKLGIEDVLLADLPEPWSLHLAGDWRAAAEAWRARNAPYRRALALSEAADDLALREALDLFRQLGARPLVARVARQLRERGVRGVARGPRPSTRSSPAGLTTREAEVLALVVEGLSNAEIASRLFLSTRTIDHHVSAILRKLDVPSRARASAAAARLGIAVST